ncbi:MAG: transcriptional regulator NrdR [Bryobacterales bacterium]|nr:transcriptional regulator NrdR [Bryobacterales bacterium]
MRCPFCFHLKDKVIDSRMSKDGHSIRRRRHCVKCGRRFTTYEHLDEIPYMVIKKDGRRERFDKKKVLEGLLRACEKRPVTMATMQEMVAAAENLVIESQDRECRTKAIGERLMQMLLKVDKLAYLRFASVYRDFKDLDQFLHETRQIRNL